MTMQSASEWLQQCWIAGELPELSEAIWQECIERVGAHIYEDYQRGCWTYEEAEASLETLERDVLDGTEWLGMPFIPEPQGGQ